MTVIEHVRVHRLALPLVRPFVTAQRSATEHHAVLVELVDSDGRSGWGEAPCSWRVTGESPESVTAAVEGPLRDAVLGASEPPSVAHALARNTAAKMAVECAVHDLAAQWAGVPLAVLLGGSVRPVRTDITLSAGAPDEVAALAAGFVADGFTTLKLKCGAGGDDVALLRAVREAVGPDVVLRADANQGWTTERAIQVVRAWEREGLDVALVEQPVDAREVEQLAAVRSAVGVPVLADESVWDDADLRGAIRSGACDLVNIKLAKSGGLAEAQRMARTARSAGVGVLLGSMMESHVGVAAAASLAAALGLDAPQDLDAGLWLRESPVRGGIRYDGDAIVLADAPGLGIGGLA